MNTETWHALSAIAAELKPSFEGRVSWDPGDPICPEWVFPVGVNLQKLIDAAMRFHIPIGCWPVGPPDGITGIRVVVGRTVRR